MSDQRRGGIAWTDVTWNVVRGCSRVSPGCQHCYAERQAIRMHAPGRPYHGLVQRSASGRISWTGRVRLARELLERPLHWTRPRRVFVNAMSDLFHERLTFPEIGEVFAAFSMWSWHTYQVLTKRPARMLEFVRWWMAGGGEEFAGEWPLKNVWLGVSCEDQQRADERIPLLLQTPAAVRWVSAEPLLGPLDLSRWMWPVHWHWDAHYRTPEEAKAAGAYAEQKPQALLGAHVPLVKWVVVGGESGPGARPMCVSWWLDLRRQCGKAAVPFFSKQAGAQLLDDTGERWPSGVRSHVGVTMEAPRRIQFRDRAGADPIEWPDEFRIREFPR